MYKNILVALEGKTTDEAAIAHATKLALEDSASMTLLQVVTIMGDDGGLRHLQLEPGASGWHRKNRAEANLTALKQRLQSSGITARTALVIGDRSEADEIADFAQKGDFQLIVLASDGRPWWKRAIFGCVADGVHHKATVPTLFVSDGSRREKVATLQHPITHNPIYDSFGSADLC